MALRKIFGRVRRHLLSRVARREVRLSNDRPLISFTFDDFPKTALFTGGAILKNRGLVGTYYAAAGLMGTTTEVGQIFDQADLTCLIEAGHELACHTYSHVSARKLSLNSYYEEVLRGQRALAQFAGASARLNFSYPFGEVTLNAKKEVGPAMPSCRGIYPGLDGPAIDLNLLHGNSIYGGLERFPSFRSLIDNNARKKTWLIFYTHDVQTNPGPYGCTPELFEKIVKTAVESGSEIVTVAEALTRSLQTFSPELWPAKNTAITSATLGNCEGPVARASSDLDRRLSGRGSQEQSTSVGPLLPGIRSVQPLAGGPEFV